MAIQTLRFINHATGERILDICNESIVPQKESIVYLNYTVVDGEDTKNGITINTFKNICGRFEVIRVEYTYYISYTTVLIYCYKL